MLQWIGRDLFGSEMYPPFLEGKEQGENTGEMLLTLLCFEILYLT